MPPKWPYCKKCKCRKEFIEPRGEGVLTRCPQCGKEAVSYSQAAYRWQMRQELKAKKGLSLRMKLGTHSTASRETNCTKKPNPGDKIQVMWNGRFYSALVEEYVAAHDLYIVAFV
ncbi:hypothetical protein [Pseudodesulfovibrio senegalensis]|uniref:Uncharacterized protein n=1 Tax=Pseudodesulfovibrio senegalensis TaxID=1721087 RepID=A0A6N6MYN7_9BACT|nr:hypothetical protein [Pseudodesulfovibrio senegalensis]KAB1440356.1 hypothetical protein F8A88_14000 [Pseudodesulfovibrio senegalensis]